MKKKTTTPKWTLSKSARNYLPKEITGERATVAKQLNVILKKRGVAAPHVEAMTDQIDVYASNRKVAIYMA